VADAAAEVAPLREQRRQACAVALTGLVEQGVLDGNRRLARQRLEPRDVEVPGRAVGRELRCAQTDHADGLVAHHQRQRKGRPHAGPVDPVTVEPPVVALRVGHEDDTPGGERHPHESARHGDDRVPERFGAGASERHGPKLPVPWFVQQHPARRGPEHVLDGIEHRGGDAGDIAATSRGGPEGAPSTDRSTPSRFHNPQSGRWSGWRPGTNSGNAR
jgi:hypothetical protein